MSGQVPRPDSSLPQPLERTGARSDLVMTTWQVRGHAAKCPACLSSHTQLFVELQVPSMVRSQASRFHFFVSLVAVINKKPSHVLPEARSGKQVGKKTRKELTPWALVRPRQWQSPKVRLSKQADLPILSSLELALI